ncbi:MAG: PqqD family protein [Acidimicrobiales bacterium]
MTELRRRPAVERELRRGRRLVHARDAATPIKLSGSAPVIWDLLSAHHDLDGLVAAAVARFPGDADIVEQGTQAAVDMFVENGLVEVITNDVVEP